VKATEAPGYKVSNPITQANASFKMRQSEDPRDQVLTTIQDRLDAVEKYQTQTTKPNEVRIYEDASPVTLLRTLIERAQAYAENGVSLSMIRQRIPELASQRGIALDKFSIDESGTMIIGYGGSGTVIQLNLSDQKPR
jgi:hypothetical protein